MNRPTRRVELTTNGSSAEKAEYHRCYDNEKCVQEDPVNKECPTEDKAEADGQGNEHRADFDEEEHQGHYPGDNDNLPFVDAVLEGYNRESVDHFDDAVDTGCSWYWMLSVLDAVGSGNRVKLAG
ncbi:uncharacterized protein BKA78DRAFT_298355 [Phyllosticta capitalensis]|uniref:uncharacterized protein n=1 Tax=Phyllosticta capitalensis TaxID=121624 RepID=UPI00312D269C